MRMRPAPSAARTDISRVRDAPRASWRLATFAHAISSTTSAAASMSKSLGLACATPNSLSAATSALVLAFVVG